MERQDMPAWLSHAVEQFEQTNHSDGDMLSHDWLKFALQIREPKTLDEAKEMQFVMLSRMDAFRDHLLNARKVALQNVRGQGYRIVPPHEQARFAADHAMRHVHKGLKQGKNIMRNTRIDALTDEERQRHTDAEVKLCGLSQMMRHQRRDVFALFKAS